MNSTKIRKERLITIIQENLSKHELEYQAAITEYRAQVVAKLKTAIKAAQKNEDINFYELNLPKPTSHSVEYQRALRMLELTEESVIELDNLSFQQLVEDEWDWSKTFKSVSSMYVKTA